MDAKSNFRNTVLQLAPYNVSGHPAKIKLNQNESPFDIPLKLKKEITEEFFRIGWNRYPSVFASELPRKLSERHNLQPDCFIVANGSNELIYTIATSIVMEGTEVLIPQPTFYLFEKICTILGGRIVKVNARADLSPDEDEILRVASKIGNGLVIIGSPNNPTGKSVTSGFLARLLESTPAIVLLDEAYIEFSEKKSAIDLVTKYENLVVLRTFSKAFSLAGLRIGYLAAHPGTAFEILKVKIPFTVNPLSEFTAVKLLEHSELFAERVDFLKKQKKEMITKLRSLAGVEALDSDSNFFLFSTPLGAREMFDRLLDKNNVLVRDVSSYPMLQKYLRVNAGSSEESAYFNKSVEDTLRNPME
ncbi:MAG TPA: histidinol-phosphate transaminase [Candidatus Kryptonia bacterium]